MQQTQKQRKHNNNLYKANKKNKKNTERTSVHTAAIQGRCADQVCDFEEGDSRSGIRGLWWWRGCDRLWWGVVTNGQAPQSWVRHKILITSVCNSFTVWRLKLFIAITNNLDKQLIKKQTKKTYLLGQLCQCCWCPAVVVVTRGVAPSFEAYRWTSGLQRLVNCYIKDQLFILN